MSRKSVQRTPRPPAVQQHFGVPDSVNPTDIHLVLCYLGVLEASVRWSNGAHGPAEKSVLKAITWNFIKSSRATRRPVTSRLLTACDRRPTRLIPDLLTPAVSQFCCHGSLCCVRVKLCHGAATLKRPTPAFTLPRCPTFCPPSASARRSLLPHVAGF